MKINFKFTVALTCAVAFLAASSFANSAEEQAKSKSSNSEKSAGEKTQEDPAIRLESVFVGDKEQPAISYFIPWQGIGAPDKLNWNVEQKHDNALDLVDREIMLRSINIYEEMNLENISN